MWTDADSLDPSVRINIVAPWRLDSLPSGIDLFANFLSCQHMRAENHAYYADTLFRKDVRSIFHMNREKAIAIGEIDLSDYPWWAYFSIGTSEISGTIDARSRTSSGPSEESRSFGIARQYLLRTR